MSTTSTPPAIPSRASSGGSAPPGACGAAPSASLRSRRVCGAASVARGGAISLCASPPSGAPITATAPPGGSVTGSTPISRSVWPSSRTRPSSTGETGQPARRRSTHRLWSNVPPSGRAMVTVAAPPSSRAARS